ncbi:MAG: hypothetical protein QG608_2656 [Actinomycetota bacterium]|nr:hypothetical protein [Actinomycetota bacterium]
MAGDPESGRGRTTRTPAERALRAREERARRAAQRQLITVNKVRRFDPRAHDYNTWVLDDPRRGVQASGLSLDDVEHYLDHGELPDTEPQT